MRMELSITAPGNASAGTVQVSDVTFAREFNEDLVHQAVVAFMSGARQGSRQQKTRSEVSGGGRKPFKQKGSGRARAGSIRSPLWRKGGMVHGPVPRDYSQDLSTGEKKNALKAVLSRKLKEARIIVLDNFAVPSHKTQELEAILTKVGAEGKILLVDARDNRNLELASRNHPGWKTVDALAVNVYDVVDRPYLVVSEQALARLVEVLGACPDPRGRHSRQQDRDSARGRGSIQGQGRRSSRRQDARQGAPPGSLRRTPLGLEKGFRPAGSG